MTRLLAYVKTDVGMVRERNEDSYIFSPPNLFAVADGMGGHVAGEVASNLAVNTVQEYAKTHIDIKSPEKVLQEAIEYANGIVYQMAQSKEDYSGMGTTFTGVYITDKQIYWGHVGDSRAYLISDSQLRQVTQDHSLVWELVQSGNLSKEEAHTHPRRNLLTRAVGTSPDVKVDIGILDWQMGDILILCTDGLNGLIDDQTIYQHIKQGEGNISSVVDTLVESAKAAGGHDNITVILLKNEGGQV